MSAPLIRLFDQKSPPLSRGKSRLLVAGFVTKQSADHSRGATLLFYGLGLVLLPLVRIGVQQLVARGVARGALTTGRAILIGTPSRITEFERDYRMQDFGVEVVTSLRLPEPNVAGGSPQERSAVIENILDIARAEARSRDVDRVFVLVPWSEQILIARCVEALMELPASIHLGPEPLLTRFSRAQITRSTNVPSINLVRPPLHAVEILAKRAFDLVVAGAGLLLLSPVLAAIAVAIKLDSPGPVLFRQRRNGYNESTFRIYKFRTMRTLDDGDRIVQATANDDRVTRIGRHLRRLSLDELPQLLNVLNGEMSIVGPRPHALVHNRDFEQRIALYARRHNVKPGITGWAQVNGLRGETDTDEKMRARVDYDLFYIDNWSLWFDIRIVALTILSRKTFSNAH